MKKSFESDFPLSSTETSAEIADDSSLSQSAGTGSYIFKDDFNGRSDTTNVPSRIFIATEQNSGMIGVYYDSPGHTPIARWLWSAKDDPNVTEEDKQLFGVPDECKLREKGKTIIMTDSCGGAAGLDVMSGLCKWYVHAGGNPHSIDILPDGRVAVVSSMGATVKIFDVKDYPFKPSNQVAKTVFELEGGHGISWDEGRNSLFVLGYRALYELDYDAESSSVSVRRSWNYEERCGDIYGHDLVPDGKGGYFFTTHTAVWYIEPDTGMIVKARDIANVKAFAPSDDGDLVTIPNESWWTDTLLMLPSGSSDISAARKIILPGAKFYKARYFTPGRL